MPTTTAHTAGPSPGLASPEKPVGRDGGAEGRAAAGPPPRAGAGAGPATDERLAAPVPLGLRLGVGSPAASAAAGDSGGRAGSVAAGGRTVVGAAAAPC